VEVNEERVSARYLESKAQGKMITLVGAAESAAQLHSQQHSPHECAAKVALIIQPYSAGPWRFIDKAEELAARLSHDHMNVTVPAAELKLVLLAILGSPKNNDSNLKFIQPCSKLSIRLRNLCRYFPTS
jgi:hypothetical protein